MTDAKKWTTTTDEEAILREEPLPPAEDEPILDDEWAEFRKLPPEEQKWALIQLELDREAKRTDGFCRGE